MVEKLLTNQDSESKDKQTNQDPSDTNMINVSTKKNPNFYVLQGKKFLEVHEIIEFHALGNAISLSTIAAENLVRNNYAYYFEIKTVTVTLDSNDED